MPVALKFAPVALLMAIAAGAIGDSAHAQAPSAPLTYARMRQGADQWHNRRGGSWNGWQPGVGYGGFWPGFYQPIITGSYYQRPYPHHFDFARGRWSGEPSANQQGSPTPATIDCPCAPEALPEPAPTEPTPSAS